MKINDFGQVAKIPRLIAREGGCGGLCWSSHSVWVCPWVPWSLRETFSRVAACHPSRSSTSMLCSIVYTIYEDGYLKTAVSVPIRTVRAGTVLELD